jgi:hypothetical protein
MSESSNFKQKTFSVDGRQGDLKRKGKGYLLASRVTGSQNRSLVIRMGL